MKYKELYGEYAQPLVFRNVLFFQTCYACPEQYDAWYDDTQIGYIRLRWGCLTATFPDVGGDLVYEAEIGDSSFRGRFTDDEERCEHLTEIAEALKDAKHSAEVQGVLC